MAIDIELITPSNYTNPVSVEAAFLANNEAIEEALSKAFSIEGGAPNFLLVDLDLNGNDLMNVGKAPFVRPNEIVPLQIGDLRKDADGNVIYSEGLNEFILFTVDELRGEPGLDGTGTGDLLKANNLSDLADPGEARDNLGLELGVDVARYSAALDGFDPATRADADDPRFERLTHTPSTGSQTISNGGGLYTASASTDFTVESSPIGSVNTVYVDIGSGNCTLAPDTGVELYVAGTSVPVSSITLSPGAYVSLVSVDLSGNLFVVSGAT